jgi:hypothetical protein
VAHGLSPLTSQHMVEDSDLQSLHGKPEFEALVAAVQKNSDQGKGAEPKK